MSIRIIARFTARPDSIDAMRTLLLGMLEPTRKEVGCVSYELLNNSADPTDFTFVEEWASQAAIDAHMKTPHLQAVVADSAPLLASPLDVRFYTVC
ncbi:MAG: antibiotic biosynthesis monooxygenase [Zoogloea sp.]|jgi:quinol monooxygenase YgiN|uniref:putative quinol monooxygenase n=1 Tax=Zoogloea sp. TaxID=49181 RepID=UPI001B549937|nr:putative quinol monooxygenase [Zoogloea sp.]MBP8266448.1 antibiotic biosynthesis monooxygenase [Zoogloea sp.]HQA10707.1 putative quinol monooxygenase [Zoogloea sp.]